MTVTNYQSYPQFPSSDGGGGPSDLSTTESVTSGASPVVCGNVDVTVVTSGGTQGVEIVQLDNLAFTVGGYTAPATFGQRHVIYLETQADPADVVKVRLNSGDSIYASDSKGTITATVSDGLVVLDYEGATAAFVWVGTTWRLDNTAYDNDSAYSADVKYIAAGLVNANRFPYIDVSGNLSYAYDPNNPRMVKDLVISDGTPGDADLQYHATSFFTTGSAGERSISELPIIDHTFRKHQHLFVYNFQGNVGHFVTVPATNITQDGQSVSAITLSAIGDYLLIEADGTPTANDMGWNVVEATPGVVTLTDSNYSTPTTGSTVTMAANQPRAILNPAGTLATLTVSLPPTPVDNQTARVSSTQVITSLTVSAPGGASVLALPSDLVTGQSFEAIYRAADTTWYPT